MTGRNREAPKPRKVERTLSAALNGDLPDADRDAICIMALHRFAEPQPKAVEDDADGMFEAARDIRAERALMAEAMKWIAEERDTREDVREALADDDLKPEMMAAPVALAEDDEVDAAFGALHRLLLTADRVKRGKDKPGEQLRDALRRHMNAMLAGAPPHPLRGIGEWEVAFLRGGRGSNAATPRT